MVNARRKQPDSSGQPTIRIRAERSQQSLASEYIALRHRRISMIAVPVLALALIAGGLYAYGLWSKPRPTPVVVAPIANVPAAAAPTAVAAVQSAAPTNVISSGIACPTIAGLPMYANATCIEHDADQDDGNTRHENTYLTSAAANDVRLFFEGAFPQNNWTISESEVNSEGNDWEYTIFQGQRRLRIDVETEHEDGRLMTRIVIVEK